jgi:hypothetical protein
MSLARARKLIKKSAIMFNQNTKMRDRERVKQVLQFTSETQNERYLGLPAHIGHSKLKAFEYIKDKIWARIQG